MIVVTLEFILLTSLKRAVHDVQEVEHPFTFPHVGCVAYSACITLQMIANFQIRNLIASLLITKLLI